MVMSGPGASHLYNNAAHGEDMYHSNQMSFKILIKMPAFVTRTCYHHYLFNCLHLIRLTECVRVPKSFITKAVNQR